MFKLYPEAIIVFVLMAASSCTSGEEGEFTDLGHPVYSFNESLDFEDIDITELAIKGTWLSEGYGYVLDITKKRSQIYNVSDSSCSFSNKLPTSLEKIKDKYIVKYESSYQKLLLRKRGDFNILVFNRIRALPLSCKSPITSNKPELNFQIFWEQLNEHYAFFRSRNVDWNKTYKTFRKKVTEATDNHQLFDIFTQMIMPLSDSHVSVHNPNRSEWSGKDLSDLDIHLHQLEEIIESDYLTGKVKTSAAGALLWGNLEENIGYLRISRMEDFGYVRNILGVKRAAGFQALDEGLRKAMSDLRDKKSIIIDIRRNEGGEDRASLLIAEYFTGEKKQAFSKKARNGDAYSPITSVYIYPVNSGSYSRPVVLLTSPLTFSAAEIFTMSMMPLPQVTLIGQNTSGGFSDVLEKSLPNGWSLNLSNEVYLTANGKSYEGGGIPPNVRTRLPGWKDVNKRTDITLEKAIQFLSKN